MTKDQTPTTRIAQRRAPSGNASVTPVARRSAPLRPSWKGGLEYGAASRQGSYHAENEDSLLLSEAKGQPVSVADGVGSGAHGQIASRTLISRIRLLTPNLLRDAALATRWLLDSDDIISAEIARHSDRVGASTFVAAVPLSGGHQWLLTWAGDCRAYRVTAEGAVLRLTEDDTYASRGESPPAGGDPSDPARMVGNGAVDKANIRETPLENGEILFLCSDGIHRFVDETEMATTLSGTGLLDERCERLAMKAHMNGGHDDATVIAVKRYPWFGVRNPVWWWALAGIVLAAVLGAVVLAGVMVFDSFKPGAESIRKSADRLNSTYRARKEAGEFYESNLLPCFEDQAPPASGVNGAGRELISGNRFFCPSVPESTTDTATEPSAPPALTITPQSSQLPGSARPGNGARSSADQKTPRQQELP